MVRGDDGVIFKEKLRFYFDFVVGLLSSLPLLFKFIYEIFVPRPEKEVRGQLALITGGANGIGFEIGLYLARIGCNIAVVDIDLEKAEKSVKTMRSYGVKAEAFKVSLCRRLSLWLAINWFVLW